MNASEADAPTYPRIVPFAHVPSASSTSGGSWIDERGALEMPLKGWVLIHVETEPEVYHEVCFYDPVRLRQDMDLVIEDDAAPCFAETAPLVLLPGVTVAAVEKSVKYLWEKGYFSYWKPDPDFNPPRIDASL